MTDPILIQIACLFTAWIFVSASWFKWKSSLQMMSIITNYHVLPFTVTRGFVVALALVESVIAALLLIPDNRQWGAFLGVVLLAVYTVAIAINLIRGRTDFDCGCSGPVADKRINSSLLWRNTVLMAVIMYAMHPHSARLLQWADYAVVILVATLFILLYHMVEQLLTNHQQLLRLKSY